MAAICILAVANETAKITPSRNYTTKTFDIKGFSSIVANGVIDVEFTQSDGYTRIEVSAPENLMQFVVVSKKGNALSLDTKPFRTKNFSSTYKITAKVTAPSVSEFTSNGAGDIKFISAVGSKKADVKLTSNGTGDIEGPTVVCSRLDARGNGTGDIEIISVTCENLDAGIAGTGDIEFKNVKSTDAVLSLSGTGDIEVKSINTGSISASQTGTGDIKIASGSAGTASYSLSGTGDIEARGLKAKQVNASNHSIGEVECYASESLSASCNGIGSIKYAGNPRNVNANGGGIKRIK